VGEGGRGGGVVG